MEKLNDLGQNLKVAVIMLISRLGKIVYVWHPFMATFLKEKNIILFSNLARIMNVLNSTEKKGKPFGTTAL